MSAFGAKTASGCCQLASFSAGLEAWGRIFKQLFLGLGFALLAWASIARADNATPPSAETVREAACRVVESAAHDTGLSVDLLTRLIWTESRFRTGAVSPAGAQGIAQFMPGTAAERGLRDPYDPEQAIPQAARLLIDLERQFGNIGLALAAYNAGAMRVANWLTAGAVLPRETQAYVLILTGRTAQDWEAAGREPKGKAADVEPRSCIEITTTLQAGNGADQSPIAPWGVQLSGNFSKAVALASFDRVRQRYLARLASLQPMVIGTRLRSRGTRRFYRVFVPASSRAEADGLCRAIMAAGGPCVALRT
jgi:soluble lytic murein transglycosylase-like protein